MLNVNGKILLLTDDPYSKSKRRKIYNFTEYYLPIVF